MRARLFAERGWVDWLPPQELAPEALADAMLAALERPVRTSTTRPDLSGLHTATVHLMAMVSEAGVAAGHALGGS